MESLLEVKNLKVSYHSYEGEIQSVRGISFTVDFGETIAIVGDAGCGKSVAAKSILGLIQKPSGEIKQQSEIWFNGKNILSYTQQQWQALREKECGLISRELFLSLNPDLPVGRQLVERIMAQTRKPKRESCIEAQNLFKLVGVDFPAKRLKQYPRDFSGTMRQRLMIAFALICKPKLLIVDEAADVDTKQMNELLKNLQRERKMAVILITNHILSAFEMVSKILVMHAGKVVEAGDRENVFLHPRHPYTQMLISGKEEMPNRTGSMEEKPFQWIDLPKGCSFHNRCGRCIRICTLHEPPVFEFEDGHTASCWLYHPLAEEKDMR